MPEETQDQTLAEVLPDAPNPPAELNPPDATAVSDEGEAEPQEIKSKGVQRRIDELTKNWRQEQREKQEILELLKTATAKPVETKAQPKQVDPEAPVKPKISDYSDYDLFDAAKDKWTEDIIEYKARKLFEGVRAQTESEKREAAWTTKLQEARKAHPDFDEVALSVNLPISQAMDESIKTSDVGTDIAYYLGTNIAEAKRIAALPSWAQQAREIGKIEARLAQDKSSGEQDPPAQTRAPRPPTPIKQTSSTDNSLRDDLSFKEFVRRREASLRSK